MSGTNAPTVRYPRLRVVANGSPLAGAVSVEITSNNHYAADRVSGEVSLAADPNFGLQWWDAQTDIQLDCQIALDNNPSPAWQSIVLATVDHLQVDLTTNCVQFEGRDLTARFIDTKTQAAYPNHTSSEIAGILAAGHGMQTSITPTKTIVGHYYQLEHDKITLDAFSHQTTEWDLLINLAQEEGYNVWVYENTLYFQPETANTKPPYQIVYIPTANGPIAQLNAERVTLERSLTLAKDIQVQIKSSNLRDGKAYIRTVKAQGAKSPSSSKSQTQNYVFVRPGLTPDQALKFGQQKLSELSKHERIINIEMPGETQITPRDMIQLSGTGTGWDLVMYIDEIHRSISFDSGFTQHIRCKNSSPRTMTTVL